ncbi:hypothetical protein [Paenibacillus kandeliae]|uniref:hypothetical protein n=1 Tax=Paenibacillus kandeliae TaxID=3231269 RepID=UPI00345765E9
MNISFVSSLLSVACVALLTACSTGSIHQPSAAAVNQAAISTASTGTIVQAQSSEAIPAQETSDLHYDEQARQALKDTLNITFKLLNAMQKNDVAYISTIAAPDVQINNERHSITVDDYERPFLKGIGLGNLEYRYYFPQSANQIELGFAYVPQGENPSYTIVFDYVRSTDGQWLYHGHITR